MIEILTGFLIYLITLIKLAPHNGVKFPSPIYGRRVRDEGNILIIIIL